LTSSAAVAAASCGSWERDADADARVVEETGVAGGLLTERAGLEGVANVDAGAGEAIDGRRALIQPAR
jgi:hypothetical protein